MSFQKVESQVQNDSLALLNVKVLMDIELESDSSLDHQSAYQLAIKQSYKEIVNG